MPILPATPPRRQARLEDVAQLAGVAKSTVSRVLIGEKTLSIRADTRERVLAAARTLDYRPDMRARSLRTRRSFLLGLVVPDTDDPTLLALIRGAHHAALTRNYSLLIACPDDEADADACRRLVEDNRIDGLLLTTAAPASTTSPPMTLRVPQVLVGAETRGDAHTVATDLDASVRLAVGHLAGLGHRRVGYACLAASQSIERVQRAGWQIALASHGLASAPVSMAQCGDRRAQAEAAIARLLESNTDRPTACCAADAPIAAMIVAVAARMGVAVPRDLSVIALRDGPIAALLTPSITAVGYPAFALGHAAASDLMDLVEGTETAPVSRLLAPGDIIHRESVAAA